MTKSFDKFEEIWIFDDIKNLPFSKSMALVYPNEYKVGSSNLGFHSIFKNLCLVGQKPSRFFYSKSTNDFISFDTDKKLISFEYIFISISFENDVENLWSYFSKFPNKNNKIIIGGSAVNLSPFLFTDIASDLAIGDCEEYFLNFESMYNLNFIDSKYLKTLFIDEKLNFFKENINQKKITLKNLEKQKVYSNKKKLEIQNEYSNKNNLKIQKDYKDKFNNKLNEINKNFYKISKTKTPVCSVFISENSAFPSYFLIEISRGCPFNCSFCTMGNLYKKYRLFDLNEILEKLSIGFKKTKNFGLISAVVPPLKYIKEIKKNFPTSSLHFSSLRVDIIDEEFLEIISEVNLQTLTIAPETAIEDIRYSIGKKFSNQQIFDFLDNAIKNGIYRFKFYFIIGLKAMNQDLDEKEKEFELFNEAKAILTFVDQAQSKIYLKYKKNPYFALSINPLIPKPLTDLYSFQFMQISLYNKIKQFMKKEIYQRKNISIEFISYNEAKKEYLLSWNLVENFKLNNNLYL